MPENSYLESLFHDDRVIEACELIAQYEVTLAHPTEDKKIRIKIFKEGEKYHSCVSHYYHGSKQFGPYISSRSHNNDSLYEALHVAKAQILDFYDPNDENAKWIENEYF